MRRKWRNFRAQVISGSLMKELTYSDPNRAAGGYAGEFRFIGDLQAIQDNSSIWLNNGSISVRAELEGVRIFLLPASESMEAEGRIEKNEDVLPQEMPKRLNWERVYSLAQGTGFLLSGSVCIENGIPVFRHSAENPLLVIIYDGKKESILRRSIWCGRQKNEYWNQITPAALLAGSFILFVLAYVLFRQPGGGVFPIAVTVMSIIPVLPFLPPGVFFYYMFRRLWKKGRNLRGERDLLRLPLRYFSENSDKIEEGYIRLSAENASVALNTYPEAALRSCGLISDPEKYSAECSVFITSDASAKKDPFFERLIIPGDPSTLSSACRSRARLMEIAAAALITLGFIINALLVFFIIYRAI